MGLFDFFRSRRRRESALPEGVEVAEPPPAGAAEVGVTAAESRVMDLQGHGQDLREAILGTLREHGVDAEKGDQVSVTDPDLQAAIFKTMSEHGLDVEQLGSAAAFGAGGLTFGGAKASFSARVEGGGDAEGSDTVGRLERLQELRERGALTDAEFEQQKRRILGD
jgi:hypothetical protein